MARYRGLVGFGIETETSLGIWEYTIIDHKMQGDILSIRSSNDDSGKINNDITLRNRFSLIFDAFALENFQNIKYIKYNGVKWEVSEIEISHPRIILSIGGVWNGN